MHRRTARSESCALCLSLRAYDTAGRCTLLVTSRNGATWVETRWVYDAVTGLCTTKIYADGSQVNYTYTSDGLLLRTTYASGRWIENVYDSRRQVVGRISDDGSHDAVFERDEFGRLVARTARRFLSLPRLQQVALVWRFAFQLFVHKRQ